MNAIKKSEDWCGVSHPTKDQTIYKSPKTEGEEGTDVRPSKRKNILDVETRPVQQMRQAGAQGEKPS